MTREEALGWFKDRKERYLLDDKCQQAEDVAIKALEQELCEDAISRQAVIKCLERGDTLSSIDHRLIDQIKNFPSVNPQPKTGHWKRQGNGFAYICSNCGKWNDKTNYCPNCGAKMEESK